MRLQLKYLGRVGLFSIAISGFSFAYSIPMAFAETPYRWEDDAGRSYFGTKPPANAKHVRKLEGGISRYSSERLLRGYLGAVRKGAPVENDLLQKPVPLSKSSREPKVISTKNGADLREQRLFVTRDENGRMNECKALVKNIGSRPADNIIVSFNFENGAVVQATGTTKLGVNEQEYYELPPQVLEAVMSSGTGEEGSLILADPKVSIEFKS